MKQFKPHVFVKGTDSGRLVIREVRTVEEAGRVHRSWPGRGKAWRAAADVLSDFQYGDATLEQVRAAFVAAAIEAKVYVDRQN